MNRVSGRLVLGVVVLCVLVCFAVVRAFAPDLARTSDGRKWDLINAEFNPSVVDGKQAVRLRPKGVPGPGSLIGMALADGVQFAEGSIDVDLKGKGKSEPSFLGVAFGVADDKTFEAVYFRPFNFLKTDKVYRARAVQYVAWPAHTWEKLRGEKPGVYESAVNPVPDPSGWFHARVEVTKGRVSVFVDGAKEPCLVVDRLAARGKGGVGLWVDSNDGAFANLQVVPAKAP